jgi:hypothetical protein
MMFKKRGHSTDTIEFIVNCHTERHIDSEALMPGAND